MLTFLTRARNYLTAGYLPCIANNGRLGLRSRTYAREEFPKVKTTSWQAHPTQCSYQVPTSTLYNTKPSSSASTSPSTVRTFPIATSWFENWPECLRESRRQSTHQPTSANIFNVEKLIAEIRIRCHRFGHGSPTQRIANAAGG